MFQATPHLIHSQRQPSASQPLPLPGHLHPQSLEEQWPHMTRWVSGMPGSPFPTSHDFKMLSALEAKSCGCAPRPSCFSGKSGCLLCAHSEKSAGRKNTPLLGVSHITAHSGLTQQRAARPRLGPPALQQKDSSWLLLPSAVQGDPPRTEFHVIITCIHRGDSVPTCMLTSVGTRKNVSFRSPTRSQQGLWEPASRPDSRGLELSHCPHLPHYRVEKKLKVTGRLCWTNTAGAWDPAATGRHGHISRPPPAASSVAPLPPRLCPASSNHKGGAGHRGPRWKPNPFR